MATYSQFAEAFAIFAKYGDDDFAVCAEHDEIFAGPDPKIVSKEDNNKLKELGWHLNDVGTFSKCV